MRKPLSLEDRLATFGEYRYRWDGSGILPTNSDQEISGRLVLAQRFDGTPVLGIESGSSALRNGIFAGTLELQNDALFGIAEGIEIAIGGRSRLVDSQYSNADGRETISAVFFLTSAEVRFRNAGPTLSSVSFDIVNFLFVGTEVVNYPTEHGEGGRLSRISLDLDGSVAILDQVSEYDAVKNRLKARKGVEVTSTLTKRISEREEIDRAIESAERITDIMSICRGTVVSWVAYTVLDADAHVVLTHLRNSVVKNYSPFPLIHDTPPESTREFLQSGNHAHRSLDADYGVRRIARAYAETRGGPFLETRALLVSVLMEFLAATRAYLEDNATVMPDPQFEDSAQDLVDAVERAVRDVFPDLPRDQVQAMAAKARGFNYRSLRSRINGLAASLELDVSSGEIAQFIEIRNSLAHNGLFPEGTEPVRSFMTMMALLDRVLLRLLGYSGEYIDPETMELAEI